MGGIATLRKIFSWLTAHNIYSVKFYKSYPRTCKSVAIITTVIYLLIIATVLTTVLFPNFVLTTALDNYYVNSLLNKIERPDTEIDPGITGTTDTVEDDHIYNIMLYGIDSRDLSEVSRSDAIMLLTIDQKAKSVKITSIARDSRVNIPGYGMDKLNHAFAYGWARSGKISGGAELSIQTINKNYGLAVDEYVTVNFWALAHIIDFVGGVNVDVDANELKQINMSSDYYTNTLGLYCPTLDAPGFQKLNGGQALAYSRIRKIDSDDMRTQRQREVLMSLFENSKQVNPLKYGELITLFLDECTSSFSNDELLSLGSWLIANVKSLKFDTIDIPTSEIFNSEMIGGVWYNAYDLDKASVIIKDFLAKELK